MDFTNRPITEFYSHCLSSAEKARFKWVVSLIARDADVEGLYSNLKQSWSSLDSLTGKHFLFIFAGKEIHTQEERLNAKIVDYCENYVGIYNDFVTFINLGSSLFSNINNNRKRLQDKYMKNMVENQTVAVNSLRDYFQISEKDIPCLIFTSLENKKNHIVAIKGNSIYDFFKPLFNAIEPKLRVLDTAEKIKDNLYNEKQKIEEGLIRITSKEEVKILLVRNELVSLAKATNNQALLECIINISYGKFEPSIRKKVNKYVDLIKAYNKRHFFSVDMNLLIKNNQEYLNQITQLEEELSIIAKRYVIVSKQVIDCITEIDNLIGESKMDNNPNKLEKNSITINGGNNQLINTYDNSTVSITQSNITDLIDSVKRTIPVDLLSEDKDEILLKLQEIQSEIKEKQPRKAYINTIIDSFLAVKGTVEFTLAVMTLANIIK